MKRGTRFGFSMAAVAGVMLLAVPAQAGRLGKTVRGISRAGGGSRGGGGGGGGGGGSHNHGRGGGGNPGHQHGVASHAHHHHGAVYGHHALLTGGSGAVAATAAPVTVDLYGGWQKVVESDGSFQLQTAVETGLLRLAGQFSSFYERQGTTDEAPMLRFHLWSATGGLALAESDTSVLHLEGGLAGFGSQGGYEPEVSGLGGTAGLAGEVWLDRIVGLVGHARVYQFGDGVRAGELSAGVQWTVLRTSYRVVDFNVGPPLRGPEIGLAFRF